MMLANEELKNLTESQRSIVMRLGAEGLKQLAETGEFPTMKLSIREAEALKGGWAFLIPVAIKVVKFTAAAVVGGVVASAMDDAVEGGGRASSAFKEGMAAAQS